RSGPSRFQFITTGRRLIFEKFNFHILTAKLLLSNTCRALDFNNSRLGTESTMVDDGKKNGLLPMVTEIVAAHLSNNTVTMTEIPRLINEVYAALSNLGQAQSKPAERQEPAIPLKKSVTADYIVCLEDGKKLKMLKRHLRTAYGLTPEQYREKWG